MACLVNETLASTPLQVVCSFVKYFAYTHLPILPTPCRVTPALVPRLLYNRNQFKSPGPEGIYPSLLNMHAPIIAQPLASIYSLSLYFGKLLMIDVAGHGCKSQEPSLLLSGHKLF